jgi:hypothetical protein
MKEERKVTVFSCDDPACSREFTLESGDPGLPDGFHGTVMQADSSGGAGGDWFACKAPHIKAAVLRAVERSWERD